MIMAIQKYGSVKGFILGFKRLLRCRYPNGGYDYP
jgi:putative component of membrane protein insertase Oxa1/YidC/SpoIIIJ protein YidD